jgi:hypothetical protein
MPLISAYPSPPALHKALLLAHHDQNHLHHEGEELEDDRGVVPLESLVGQGKGKREERDYWRFVGVRPLPPLLFTPLTYSSSCWVLQQSMRSRGIIPTSSTPLSPLRFPSLSPNLSPPAPHYRSINPSARSRPWTLQSASMERPDEQVEMINVTVGPQLLDPDPQGSVHSGELPFPHHQERRK